MARPVQPLRQPLRQPPPVVTQTYQQQSPGFNQALTPAPISPSVRKKKKPRKKQQEQKSSGAGIRVAVFTIVVLLVGLGRVALYIVTDIAETAIEIKDDPVYERPSLTPMKPIQPPVRQEGRGVPGRDRTNFQ